MAGPDRRVPDNRVGRAGVAVDDQDQAGGRHQGVEAFVAAFAKPADERGARRRHGRDQVDADEQDETKDQEKHRVPRVRGRGMRPNRRDAVSYSGLALGRGCLQGGWSCADRFGAKSGGDRMVLLAASREG